MGILNVATVIALATSACYAPDLRDCTVTCARTVECATGQVCGADHFCAAPDVAGSCAGTGMVDARPPADARAPADARPIDARPIDAPPPPPTVALQIQIMGPGSVALAGVGSCTMNCTLQAPAGKLATLTAAANPNQMFDQWTTPTCGGQGATCMFLAIAPTTVGVRFRKAN